MTNFRLCKGTYFMVYKKLKKCSKLLEGVLTQISTLLETNMTVKLHFCATKRCYENLRQPTCFPHSNATKSLAKLFVKRRTESLSTESCDFYDFVLFYEYFKLRIELSSKNAVRLNR